VSITKILLQQNASVNLPAKGGSTPIVTAAQAGHTGVVQMLLASGADVHMARSDGTTALTAAAANGHRAVVHALVEVHADPHQHLTCCLHALHIFAAQGSLHAVQLLLNVDASVDIEAGPGPAQGLVPVQLAMERGHWQVAKVLQEGAVSQANSSAPADVGDSD